MRVNVCNSCCCRDLTGVLTEVRVPLLSLHGHCSSPPAAAAAAGGCFPSVFLNLSCGDSVAVWRCETAWEVLHSLIRHPSQACALCASERLCWGGAC